MRIVPCKPDSVSASEAVRVGPHHTETNGAYASVGRPVAHTQWSTSRWGWHRSRPARRGSGCPRPPRRWAPMNVSLQVRRCEAYITRRVSHTAYRHSSLRRTLLLDSRIDSTENSQGPGSVGPAQSQGGLVLQSRALSFACTPPRAECALRQDTDCRLASENSRSMAGRRRGRRRRDGCSRRQGARCSVVTTARDGARAAPSQQHVPPVPICQRRLVQDDTPVTGPTGWVQEKRGGAPCAMPLVAATWPLSIQATDTFQIDPSWMDLIRTREPGCGGPDSLHHRPRHRVPVGVHHVELQVVRRRPVTLELLGDRVQAGVGVVDAEVDSAKSVTRRPRGWPRLT